MIFIQARLDLIDNLKKNAFLTNSIHSYDISLNSHKSPFSYVLMLAIDEGTEVPRGQISFQRFHVLGNSRLGIQVCRNIGERSQF